jgi:hypothetical protein
MACAYRETNMANGEGTSGASGGWRSRSMTHGAEPYPSRMEIAHLFLPLLDAICTRTTAV